MHWSTRHEISIQKKAYKNTKVKVQLSLCLSGYTLCHDDIWRGGGIAPTFFTSALGGVERSAYAPDALPPGVIRGWVGPSVSLDAADETKILHCQE